MAESTIATRLLGAYTELPKIARNMPAVETLGRFGEYLEGMGAKPEGYQGHALGFLGVDRDHLEQELEWAREGGLAENLKRAAFTLLSRCYDLGERSPGEKLELQADIALMQGVAAALEVLGKEGISDG